MYSTSEAAFCFFRRSGAAVEADVGGGWGGSAGGREIIWTRQFLKDVCEPTGKIQTRYTGSARLLIDNSILKEVPEPLIRGLLVALRTTLRCKNPRY
jgi:hypothetical protein